MMNPTLVYGFQKCCLQASVSILRTFKYRYFILKNEQLTGFIIRDKQIAFICIVRYNPYLFQLQLFVNKLKDGAAFLYFIHNIGKSPGNEIFNLLQIRSRHKNYFMLNRFIDKVNLFDSFWKLISQISQSL